MKALLVAGARPNFMKIAPLVAAFEARGVQAPVVHTGQHYDERMSRLFFDELELPRPVVDLGVGSGSHPLQTARIMERFEPVLAEQAPDHLLVVGDVNSTVACALVAAKQPVVLSHVEAGLRSFDRTMPEEVNRIVTDSISDLLYCSEPSGVENLAAEGVHPSRVELVGNVMIDTLLKHRERAAGTGARERLAPPGDYALVTLHRPSNVDDERAAEGLVGALERVAERVPLVFAMHPRTRAAFERHGLLDRASACATVLPPQGYLAFLDLLAGARLVITDSGGIQEETTVLGVRCLTVRPNTERPVTVSEGTNQLVGNDPEAVVQQSLAALAEAPDGRVPAFWDGRAAERVVDHLLSLDASALLAARTDWRRGRL